MASTTIIDFWRGHRQFWLPTTPAAKAEADAVISTMWWALDWPQETLAGQVIYLDQFSRHFQRAGLTTEEDVLQARQQAVTLVRERQSELAAADEVELVFCLMPFKHLEDYQPIFWVIHNAWLPAREGEALASLTQFPTLQRFYIDTYKKAYTFEQMRANFQGRSRRIRSYDELESNGWKNDAAVICDSYPAPYAEDAEAWKNQVYEEGVWCKEVDSLRAALEPYSAEGAGPVLVSLSGGVDSMVMLALLAAAGADVTAVHIHYGNRPEANQEAEFLMEYCRRLDVPIRIYKIRWLRRGRVDREFYETMTRQIRFWVYECCAASADTPVYLGHIQDDVVENIWTNIANGTHMSDLKKMRAEEVQMGVRLVRPFLRAEKRTIYAVAERLAIPYLKNTTPAWSNRGKFRDQFHAATLAQFGAGVDSRLVAFAEAIERQAALMSKFIYEPVYASWCEGTINISVAVEAGLDEAGWTRIMETLFHTRLACTKPSKKAVGEFCRRLQRGRMSWMMHLTGEVDAHVWSDEAGGWRMKLERCGQ